MNRGWHHVETKKHTTGQQSWLRQVKDAKKKQKTPRCKSSPAIWSGTDNSITLGFSHLILLDVRTDIWIVVSPGLIFCRLGFYTVFALKTKKKLWSKQSSPLQFSTWATFSPLLSIATSVTAMVVTSERLAALAPNLMGRQVDGELSLTFTPPPSMLDTLWMFQGRWVRNLGD